MSRDLWWKVTCDGPVFCRAELDVLKRGAARNEDDALIEDAEGDGWSYRWDDERKAEVWRCPRHKAAEGEKEEG